MRILLLTQKLPLPLQDGYNLRIYHYVRRLGERHEIHLASLDEGEFPADLEDMVEEVTRLRLRRPPRASNPVQKLVQAFSADHLHDRDPEVQGMVESLVLAGNYDVIWVSGWKMLVYTRGIALPPVFADVVDEGAREAWIDLWKERSPKGWLYAFKRWWTCRAFERRFFTPAALCNFVADQDAEATERLCPGLRTSVVHNGVDADFFHPMEREEVANSLVFEGGMRHVPNIEGVLHFHQHVLPLVREQVPDVSFKVVGKDPTPEVQAIAGPGVEVTGFVEDVRPHLAEASLFLSPLIGGAGIKNKILQAWAMGKAVVSTSISCGGLAAKCGENIVVADGPRAYADACIRLLGDPEERRRLGEAGRATVLERYTWDAKARELEALLEGVTAAPELEEAATR